MDDARKNTDRGGMGMRPIGVVIARIMERLPPVAQVSEARDDEHDQQPGIDAKDKGQGDHGRRARK